MEITKVKEISSKLADAVLNAEPGTQEYERAVKANDDWIRTLSDIKKAEDETRIKQNAADDQLVAKRDEDTFRIQQAKEKKWIDRLNFGVTAVTAFTFCWSTIKAVNAEIRNEPIMGLAEKLVSTSTRFMIKR